ncbi:MAG: carbamoyl phosphate synthase large subunit, partial [Pseudohongiellaceae bacterium]
CIGTSLAKVAAKCMIGKSLADQGFTSEIIPRFYSVKEAVFPFNKFPGVDPILGPEMKSTGEVMGSGSTFAEAYYKSQGFGEGVISPSGTVFISVRDVDKGALPELAKNFHSLGYKLVATKGSARVISEAGIPVDSVNKVMEGRPHIVDMLKNDEIELIVNTTEGRQAIADSATIRSTALRHGVYCTTTIASARAVYEALVFGGETSVNSLQDLHSQS